LRPSSCTWGGCGGRTMAFGVAFKLSRLLFLLLVAHGANRPLVSCWQYFFSFLFSLLLYFHAWSFKFSKQPFYSSFLWIWSLFFWLLFILFELIYKIIFFQFYPPLIFVMYQIWFLFILFNMIFNFFFTISSSFSFFPFRFNSHSFDCYFFNLINFLN
jgi:hypothetical protein